MGLVYDTHFGQGTLYMELTKSTLIHHLLNLGLISPRSCMDGEFMVAESNERNRLFRVSRTNDSGYFVKYPLTHEINRMYTLWVEATCYWLVNNDPAFSSMRQFIPEFHHYDYHKHILILGMLPEAESLHSYHWRTNIPDQRLGESIAVILATLHGEVSKRVWKGQAASLFSQNIPWALTLHDTSSCLFQPQTHADRSILLYVRSKLELCRILEIVQINWVISAVIHGDIKWSNFLVTPNADQRDELSLKLIDWEIASIGDPLWDIAGVFCSYLLFGFYARKMLGRGLGELDIDSRVFAILAQFWRVYCGVIGMDTKAKGSALIKSITLAGVRMIQSCLESASFNQRFDRDIYMTLRLGEYLILRPQFFSEHIEDETNAA